MPVYKLDQFIGFETDFDDRLSAGLKRDLFCAGLRDVCFLFGHKLIIRALLFLPPMPFDDIVDVALPLNTPQTFRPMSE